MSLAFRRTCLLAALALLAAFAPLAQPELIEQSHVSLKPLPGKEATGKVLILDSQFVFAILVSLPSGDPTLTITTTIGNEVVNCETSATDGICSGLLRGDALIGGVAFIASSETPVAKGTIQAHDGNGD